MENYRKTISKFFKNITFSIVVLAAFFTVLNFLTGFIVRNTYIRLTPLDEQSAKTSYGYFKPNQNKIIVFPGLEPYTVNINSLGLRSTGCHEELFQDKQAYRILSIGDSVTFGLFVGDRDSYPYRLQSLLTDKKLKAIVFNAGIGSATVTDSLYYLYHKGMQLEPDMVILNFHPNDLTEIRDTASLYERILKENVSSPMRTLKLTKIMRLFRSWEVHYKYRRYLGKVRDLKAKDILSRESKDLNDLLYISVFQEGDQVMRPYHEKFTSNWEQYFKELKEMVDLLREKNIGFLYVIYPDILTLYDKAEGYYQDILIEFLKKNDIEYIDLRPIFKKKRNEYLKLYNNPPRDFHLSGYGSEILAEEIFARIKQRVGK